jgi:WD40 repeat protein
MSRANPFRALRPYRREDSGRFFGRDSDLVLVKSRLLSARTMLLFAGSGVGKTSFLNARLRPALEADWFIVSHNAWAANSPLGALRSSVLQAAGVADFNTSNLPELLAGIAVRKPDKPKRCLIILDQFEELFQHWRDYPEIDQFAIELARTASPAALDTRLLFSMREEFLGELSLFDTLLPDLFGNSYRLKNPDREEAAEIIERTAGRTSEEGLEILLEDLIGLHAPSGGSGGKAPENGSSLRNRIALPFLQIVCHRIWDEDKQDGNGTEFLSGYQAARASAELREYCKLKLDTELQESEQDLASEAFGFLMTKRGAKMAYELDNLAEHMGHPKEELRSVLAKLSQPDVRILREFQGGSGGSPWFELYHDMYAPFLFEWKAHHDAQRNEQRERVLLQEIERKASTEVRRKATRILGITGVVVTVLFVACSLIAVRLYRHYGNVSAYLANPVPESFGSATASMQILRRVPVLGSHMRDRWAAFWHEKAQQAAARGERDSAIIFGFQALREQSSMLGSERRQLAAWIGNSYRHLVRIHRIDEEVQGAAVTADGKTLLIHLSGGRVERWDRETRTALSISGPLGFVPIAFSPDGRYLLAAKSGTVALMDPTKHTIIDSYKSKKTGAPPLAAFSPDQSRFAIYSDGHVSIRPLPGRSGDPIAISVPDLISMSFALDSNQLITADAGYAVTSWDSASGNIKSKFQVGHQRRGARRSRFAIALLPLPNGNLVVSIPHGELAAYAQGKRIWSLPNKAGRVAYLPQNTIVVASSAGVSLLSVSDGKPAGSPTRWQCGQGDPTAVLITPDRHVLIAAGGMICEWSSEPENDRRPSLVESAERPLALSPDGRLLVAVGNDRGLVKSLSDPARTAAVRLQEFTGSASFSPDGTHLLTVSNPQGTGSGPIAAQLIDLNSDTHEPIKMPFENIQSLSAQWASNTLIAVSLDLSDGPVCVLWDTSTRQPTPPWRNCKQLRASPDGSAALILSTERKLLLADRKGDTWSVPVEFNRGSRIDMVEVSPWKRVFAISEGRLLAWDWTASEREPVVAALDVEALDLAASSEDDALVASATWMYEVHFVGRAIPILLSRPLEAEWSSIFRTQTGAVQCLLDTGDGTYIAALWKTGLGDVDPLGKRESTTWDDVAQGWSQRLDLKLDDNGHLVTAIGGHPLVTPARSGNGSEKP